MKGFLLLVGAAFWAASAGSIYWHFQVMDTIEHIGSEFDSFVAAETPDARAAEAETLSALLTRHGYDESASKVGEFAKAHSGAPPTAEELSAFHKDAMPTECPCRLSLATLLFILGSIVMLRTLRLRSQVAPEP